MFTRPARALLASALAGAALLGGAESALAAPAPAATTPSGTPAVTLTPDTLDFGDVPVGGDSRIVKIKLKSTGTADVHGLWSVGTSGEDVAVFAKDQYDALKPGATREYNVSVEPMTASAGTVDATLTFEFGDATQRRFVPLHVKYRAVVPPPLPFKHFDLSLNGDLWLQMYYENYTLRPIGTTVAPYTFPIHSGSVSADHKGVLSSYGGLELHRWGHRAWSKIGVDLNRGHLTAVVEKGGPRVDIADVPPLEEGYDLFGNREYASWVYLNDLSASMLNATGLRPTAKAGDRFGVVSMLK